LKTPINIEIYFSDYFNVAPSKLESEGAFNISLINDLPLFIDPFLLFNSQKLDYQQLHANIIRYIAFLRDKSIAQKNTHGLLLAWFTFPEIKQNWLGFSREGNKGRGLGIDFASALNRNLHTVFSSFGKEKIARGSHLEKLCLIKGGVGRDNISDFTTNLIKSYLLDYTQGIAVRLVDKKVCKKIVVANVEFSFETESWVSRDYTLPFYKGDYVLLTPKDMLTRDETWINRNDMVRDYDKITAAIPDTQLREQINNYFMKILPQEPSEKERREAAADVFVSFPQLIEYYIRNKEENGDLAKSISKEKVAEAENAFILKVKDFVTNLANSTEFYNLAGKTLGEARQRIDYLKRVIENQGGHKLFYANGKPIRKESDVQLMFKLTWFGTLSDVSSEVNDGRGPADFKVSRDSKDKTIVEFKLASNPQLKRNLQNQVELYKRASNASSGLTVILYFSQKELDKVNKILKELGLQGNANIVLIDARADNKPSASKA